MYKVEYVDCRKAKGMVISDENISSGNLFKVGGKAEYLLDTGILYTQDQSICQNMQQEMYSRIQMVSYKHVVKHTYSYMLYIWYT